MGGVIVVAVAVCLVAEWVAGASVAVVCLVAGWVVAGAIVVAVVVVVYTCWGVSLMVAAAAVVVVVVLVAAVAVIAEGKRKRNACRGWERGVSSPVLACS